MDVGWTDCRLISTEHSTIAHGRTSSANRTWWSDAVGLVAEVGQEWVGVKGSADGSAVRCQTQLYLVQ